MWGTGGQLKQVKKTVDETPAVNLRLSGMFVCLFFVNSLLIFIQKPMH